MLEEFYSLTHILQALSHTHTQGYMQFYVTNKSVGRFIYSANSKEKKKKEKKKKKKKRGGVPNFSNVESE